MKISFFITTLGGGGAERVLTDLANYLANQGHSIEIAVLRKSNIQYELNSSINVVFLPDYYPCRKCTSKHFRETTISKKYLISKTKDECVVAFLELPMLLSLHFKKKMKCKLIVSERSFPLYYSKLYQFALSRLIKRADAAVFQTNEARKWYKRYKGTALIIPNAISKKFIDAGVSSLQGNSILSIGRIDENKNHKLLIDAFSNINEKFPSCKLFIYGNGPLKVSLTEYVESLGLSDKIVFEGFCNDISSKLMNASMFVLTSKFEGMPNSLMEAMALGVPSITTDCFGNDGDFKLVEDGINALIVPKDDKKALSFAMEKVLQNKAFAAELAQNAIKVRDKFSPNVIYRLWENLIESVLKC